MYGVFPELESPKISQLCWHSNELSASYVTSLAVILRIVPQCVHVAVHIMGHERGEVAEWNKLFSVAAIA